jgi:hypothetical protein
MQESSPESWARMARLYAACGAQATELLRGGDRGADRFIRARGRKGASAPARPHMPSHAVVGSGSRANE